jgi:transglutaminase-like putative cysteine protease
MYAASRSAVAALAIAASVAVGSQAAAPREERFQAHHEATIKDIPAGAKKARIWLVVPREDAAQEIGEIKLSGAIPGKVVRGGTYNNRFAYFEVDNPAGAIKVAADFDVKRREVNRTPDVSAARPMGSAERSVYALELDANRYVPVGDRYGKLAREIVGIETNPMVQAKMVYAWVLDYVEYWVKDPKTLKASPNGESEYCLVSKTGNCTDFHSLYASLTRSLGIPSRMVYGSFFQGENTPIPNKATLDGKDTDASYHCWIEVYAKGVGWVPLDVALADLLPEKTQQDYYFGNLEPRRVTWSYGRDLVLAPKQDAGPVNAMHKVYVEVDGKPHTAWDRKFTYASIPRS